MLITDSPPSFTRFFLLFCPPTTTRPNPTFLSLFLTLSLSFVSFTYKRVGLVAFILIKRRRAGLTVRSFQVFLYLLFFFPFDSFLLQFFFSFSFSLLQFFFFFFLESFPCFLYLRKTVSKKENNFFLLSTVHIYLYFLSSLSIYLSIYLSILPQSVI
ncbi:unnamed protein product [Acanthosepion pharaonis]|uniref:Uncharacterized protein n=1 Tax=Acanthosepion pharaonis TaxID=158019 RepID=A0A812BHF6_ACAPH|nr:unnamed protein product [Sepia pharaonis]